MKDFFKKYKLLISATILIVLFAGFSVYQYYAFHQQIKNLNSEKEALNQLYLKTKSDLYLT
jgi:hypothetical protein